MVNQRYRNVIIGSGEAGKYLAWHFAQAGESTVVIEKGALGGSCPNVACLPSKNVIHSAKVKAIVDRAAEFGVSTGEVSVDMTRVLQRKKTMVHDLAEMHQKRFAASGVPVLYGEGSFLSNTLVDIAERDGSRLTVQGERIFIATGSRASIPDVPGLREAEPMTHVEALDLEHVPNHLAILGGGYVGLEMAQALARLGSRITIVVKGTRLLPHEDDDVSDAMFEMLKGEGIEIILNTNLQRVVGRNGEVVKLHMHSQGQHAELEVTDILVAAGRAPNTDRLNAALAGVELTERGHIKVNERLETTAENIWAMGDVAGSPMFTHVSLDDFRIVRDNLQGGDRSTYGRLVPYVLFTDPPLSRIGLTETQTQQQAIPHQVATIPMAAVLRTRTLSETEGFAKIIVDHDGRILGFSALGVESSEMLAAVQTAMIAGLPYQTIRDTIYPHPTLSEGLGALLASINIQSCVKCVPHVEFAASTAEQASENSAWPAISSHCANTLPKGSVLWLAKLECKRRAYDEGSAPLRE